MVRRAINEAPDENRGTKNESGGIGLQRFDLVGASRHARTGPHLAPPIWLVMQTRRTQGRQNRAESRYHYLSPGGAGKKGIHLTRILRPTKTPTQKFAWHRRRFTRVPTPLWERASRLMKIGFESRNLRRRRRRENARKQRRDGIVLERTLSPDGWKLNS